MSRNDLVTLIQADLATRGWQQNQFAKAAGIAESTVSDVLAGKKKPGIRFFVKISDLLGKTPGELLDIYLRNPD